MRNINLRNSIFMIVVLSGGIWFILAIISGLDLSIAGDFFSLVPKVVTVDLFFIILFSKWGWKFKIFRGWLVPYPNLNGSWVGHIYSNWINPDTGQLPAPIPTMLTVKQTFFNISCVIFTGEMKSYSFLEGFVIHPERQLKQLSYVYTSKPSLSVSDRSSPHDGAVLFDIVEKPKLKLNGRYWTDRKTTGEINLEFESKKILEELPERFGKHPLENVYF